MSATLFSSLTATAACAVLCCPVTKKEDESVCDSYHGAMILSTDDLNVLSQVSLSGAKESEARELAKLRLLHWICQNPGMDAVDAAKYFELDYDDAAEYVRELLADGSLEFAE